MTVVGIGASAGDLAAAGRLLDAVPADTGMAFILVQHLDPDHPSLLAGLLARHTRMLVCEAADAMPIEPDHLYVIAPGTVLSVDGGKLAVSLPTEPHGSRLPIDVLFAGLAAAYGPRAAVIILSGTGSDGSRGVRAIKAAGGRVFVQSPAEAEHSGMPQSAIDTGEIDRVLKLEDIPGALLNPLAKMPEAPAEDDDWLAAIIELLRARTLHDFRAYKPGTLARRIERRMGLAGVPLADHGRYLALVERDAGERDQLARDLLINVTRFFRDQAVFDRLADTIIPDLVAGHSGGGPLRVWVAGCSTGEETYSLAMLLSEAIAASGRAIRLQLFASDIDPRAVARGRDGRYPGTIAADVTSARLARFFVREDDGYRVSAELRALIVFTVHDVLTDPPFSRIDLVSCRNLLIYLGRDAQANVIARCHFALREGGILLLGAAETPGDIAGRFEVVAKAERIYRHIGRHRPGGFDLPAAAPARADRTPTAAPRAASLAAVCRQAVLDTLAPTAVLIDARGTCLYALGQTHRYLSVAPGHASHDIVAMVTPPLRDRLCAAIEHAVGGARTEVEGDGFTIVVHPASADRDELLVTFSDTPPPAGPTSPAAPPEAELSAARAELAQAVRRADAAGEQQRSASEEARSINEEFQSTNEELLTSKEELQSLNEELTVLNGQLQETLEQQRTTADDMANVLNSTDVATLFLDRELAIRFFTPATRSMFSIIPGDIGRPLADLQSLSADRELAADADAVLRDETPVERTIATSAGLWCRRILPYRAHGGAVGGVVITFIDITERHRAAEALEAARRTADAANAAKSRFLAAASHDLRQPLQTLTLLQGLLAKAVSGERAVKLVTRFDETLGAMSGMLNTLLDINQIEAGTVRVELANLSVDALFGRLRDEFAYHAAAKRLDLRVVRCGLEFRSDPRLLEQMIRNLVSNALKYTERGRVLIGCRRRAGGLEIEVWDTGIGIPEAELSAIFEEYRQLGNDARERARGLGLGLAIVRRLGDLLGHNVSVRSRAGRGSVFGIAVPIAAGPTTEPSVAVETRSETTQAGAILIVEDDPEVRGLLELLLADEGYGVATAVDGASALTLVEQGARPDLIVSDYNLPGGMDGLVVTDRLRAVLGLHIPVVILTGDISTAALTAIAAHACVQLNKPVKAGELTGTIERLLAAPPPATGVADGRVVYIVDDDHGIRATIRAVLEADGHAVEDFASGEGFLQAYEPGREACLLVDAYMPDLNGIDLLRRLNAAGHRLPAIMITGASDVAMAVEAMKAGALDFIEKPIGAAELLAGVAGALAASHDGAVLTAFRAAAAAHLAGLTTRQRQVMALVLAGHPSKNIAADLGISQRTVENHRASIMARTGAKSLPALARLALAGSGGTNGGQR